jgi:signal transduction histidine kinase
MSPERDSASMSPKNIIEAHQGRVWAESEGDGKGSKFIIELPINSVE